MVFLNLLEDNKDKRNRCVFDILDVNSTGMLDIMILMQLYNNIERETMFAQEILKIVREFKNKNILLKGGYKRRILLNFTTFNTLISNSCLIEELQYRIFGMYIPQKP